MSTKSTDHISSLLKTITDRLGNFLLIDLCNSSANVSFQLFIFFFFFTQTEMVFSANYWFNYKIFCYFFSKCFTFTGR